MGGHFYPPSPSLDANKESQAHQYQSERLLSQKLLKPCFLLWDRLSGTVRNALNVPSSPAKDVALFSILKGAKG